MRTVVNTHKSVLTDLDDYKRRLEETQPSIDQSIRVDLLFRDLKRHLARTAGHPKAAVELADGTFELEYVRRSVWVRYQVVRSWTRTDVTILSWRSGHR